MANHPHYSFKNINASGTTVVSRQSGLLHSVVINTTASTGIAIYDGTTVGGTLIATLGSSIVSGASPMYDIQFSSGLTVVVGGNQDITLSIG
jgi:hypothetical protein